MDDKIHFLKVVGILACYTLHMSLSRADHIFVYFESVIIGAINNVDNDKCLTNWPNVAEHFP